MVTLECTKYFILAIEQLLKLAEMHSELPNPISVKKNAYSE